MRKVLLLVAIAMTLGSTVEAFADDDDARGGARAANWLSEAAIKSKLSDLGYTVRKIEEEDGRYEVKGTDKNGARVKMYVDPVTGEIEKPSTKKREEEKSEGKDRS